MNSANRIDFSTELHGIRTGGQYCTGAENAILASGLRHAGPGSADWFACCHICDACGMLQRDNYYSLRWAARNYSAFALSCNAATRRIETRF
jgi:hypothetical protein